MQRKITCGCGTSITTNRDSVDCMKCKTKIYFVKPGEVFPVDETHQDGVISIEQNIEIGAVHGDLGIQIASDGRIWVCLNGKALIRFAPNSRYQSILNSNSFTCQKCNEIVFHGDSHKCRERF